VPEYLLPDCHPFGHEIHRSFDEFGPLQVFDDGNKRYLSFGTADEQSCQLKQQPLQLQHDYLRAMLAVICQRPGAELQPGHATVLGLGGGLLAAKLWQLLPAWQIQAVELRPAVVRIARQYFALPRDTRLQVEVDSAQHFVNQAVARQQSTGLLFSDLYLADGLSAEQQQQEFLQQCGRYVSDDGWLVLNLWKEHKAEGHILQQLQHDFSTVLQATTHDGNWLIWASRRPAREKQAARQQCKRLQPQLGFNPWSYAKQFYRHRS